MTSPLNKNVQAQLLRLLSEPMVDAVALNSALRLLSKWRNVLIQNSLLQVHGTVVLDGCMKGMKFLSTSAEGCHVPKLLGCYEQPLQAYIEQVVKQDYRVIINVGCAEGYYAVGLARRMPNTQVLAFDLNPDAQRTCAELAALNGVANRISIGGLFTPGDFARFAGQKVLLLCDIEGGESNLLDPYAAPALAGMDIIVESHECLTSGITQTLLDRFSPTHDIVRVEDDGQRVLNASCWFNNLAHLDQLLAVWEWRAGATPWLVMKARQ